MNLAVIFRVEFRERLNYRPHCSSNGAAGVQLLGRYLPSLLPPDALRHARWLSAEEGDGHLDDWK